jgi:hypothetical protein
LGPGKYVVKYTMRFVIHEEQYAFPEEQPPTPIFMGSEHTFDIYGGGAFRQKDAEIIELKSGAVNNADVVIPLAKLHPLTGRVAAFSDGHLLNHGSAELLPYSATAYFDSRWFRKSNMFCACRDRMHCMTVAGRILPRNMKPQPNL